jgi:hypothetical protein
VVSSRNWLFSAVIAVAVATMSAASLEAQGPATICKDGTTSVSSGRGACSGHGGVDRKAVSRQKKAARSEAKAAGTLPRTSATARTRASSKSAVVRGSGAAEDNNPASAIARCKDGLYSHAKNRRGACSRHGGVASWL